MRNHDEGLLRRRRLDPASRVPLLHQALRIVLYNEFAARAFYRKVLEAFGPRAPFPAVLNRQEKRVADLSALCRQFGVPRPLDPFVVETTIAPDWRENCERAVAGEASKIRLYESLLAGIDEPDVAGKFRRLLIRTSERDLPAFQKAAIEARELERLHVEQGVPPEQAYMRHGPFSDFLEKTFAILGRQHQAVGVVAPVLRNVHPAMLAGFAAGGAGVLLVRSRLDLNRNGKDG